MCWKSSGPRFFLVYSFFGRFRSDLGGDDGFLIVGALFLRRLSGVNSESVVLL